MNCHGCRLTLPLILLCLIICLPLVSQAYAVDELASTKEIALSSALKDGEFHIYYCTHKVKRPGRLSQVMRSYGNQGGVSTGLLPLAKKKNAHIKNFKKMRAGELLQIPLMTTTAPGRYSEAMPCRAYLYNDKNIIINSKQPKLLHVDNKLYLKTGLSYRDGQNITLALNSSGGRIKNREPAGAWQKLAPVKPLVMKSSFAVTAGTIYESIHSPTPLPTELVSKAQPTINLALTRYWSKHWQSQLKGSFTQQFYTQSQGGSITLPESEFNSFGLDFGLRYSWERATYMQLDLGFGDFSYYKLDTPTSYRLAQGKTTRVNLLGGQRLLGDDELDLGFLLGVGFTGASYADPTNFKGGTHHGLGLRMNYFYLRHGLSVLLFYKQGAYRSDFSNFEKRWFHTTLTYTVGF